MAGCHACPPAQHQPQLGRAGTSFFGGIVKLVAGQHGSWLPCPPTCGPGSTVAGCHASPPAKGLGSAFAGCHTRPPAQHEP
eukprot:1160188-Pelagomonas_calceolata.AAC.3